MNIKATVLWVVQGVIAVFSVVITFLPMIYALSNKQPEFLGLNWIWWAIIGFSIFLAVITSVIIRLILSIRYFQSEDAKLDRKKKQLEIEKLEREKPSELPRAI
jgi:uncharacterized membrane protein